MRQHDLSLIRQLPLFTAIEESHFALLMKSALLQRLPEGVLLIEEGNRPDFLYVVVEGTVELFAGDRYRETTIDILSPVSTFILAAVARDEAYLKSARTLTAARVLLIPAPAVRNMLDRDTVFARAMINELAARYRDIVPKLKDQKLRSGAERLANWILETRRSQGSPDYIDLNYEKRTIASLLGMTPENLSRALAQLAAYGVVSHGKKLQIIDKSALETFARTNAVGNRYN